MLKQRNSKIQGLVGIGKAIEYFSSKGYIISIPLVDSQEYDLLVDIDDIIHKVQVKTATNPGKVDLRSKSIYSNKEFNNLSVDIVFIVTDFACFCIPSSEITAKCAISVTEHAKYTNYKV